MLLSNGLWHKPPGTLYKNSNFYRLLVTHGEDNSELLRWIGQKHGRKYTSHDMQNEMLKVMALQILREVAANESHIAEM